LTLAPTVSCLIFSVAISTSDTSPPHAPAGTNRRARSSSDQVAAPRLTVLLGTTARGSPPEADTRYRLEGAPLDVRLNAISLPSCDHAPRQSLAPAGGVVTRVSWPLSISAVHKATLLVGSSREKTRRRP